jgi:DNA-binding CsgD family transcriptional regulator
MPDATSLLRVTEGLYGAAMGLGTWTAALDRLGEAMRADHLFLHAGRSVISARIDERDLVRSLSLWPVFDHDGPRAEGLGDGEVVLRSALIADAEYERTDHFNELIRPLGGFHGMMAKGTAAAAGSALVLCRGARHAAFDDYDCVVAAALIPHISLAIALGPRSLEGAAPIGDHALLEAVRGPALICDAAGRLLNANSEARALLEAFDGIAISANRLAAMNPADTPRLRNAIASAASEGERGSLRLRRRPGRLPLSLRLVPVGRLGPAFGDPCSVAIFATEPDAMQPIVQAAIAEAFGLAPREAEIASLLAAGLSVTDIASATGLGAGSVRTYLKRIYAKTRARSQSALVALLRGFT